MKLKQFVFNALGENTFVLNDSSGECIIVDPGCYETSEKDELDQYIDNNNLKVVALVNTHCHIDHVLGNSYVKNKYGVDLYIHKEDLPTLKSCEIVAPMYGFNQYEASEADKFLEEGDTIGFGNTELTVLFVPGHAPGHIALINENEKICINGDVLFQQSIGRTDLPGGDFDTLISSIQNKLFQLSDETVIYCGHGPSTTIGVEKQHNPFCRISKN